MGTSCGRATPKSDPAQEREAKKESRFIWFAKAALRSSTEPAKWSRLSRSYCEGVRAKRAQFQCRVYKSRRLFLQSFFCTTRGNLIRKTRLFRSWYKLEDSHLDTQKEHYLGLEGRPQGENPYTSVLVTSRIRSVSFDWKLQKPKTIVGYVIICLRRRDHYLPLGNGRLC